MEKQQIGIQKASVGSGESCPVGRRKSLEAFPRRRGWKGHLLKLLKMGWVLGRCFISIFPGFLPFVSCFSACLKQPYTQPAGSPRLLASQASVALRLDIQTGDTKHVPFISNSLLLTDNISLPLQMCPGCVLALTPGLRGQP